MTKCSMAKVCEIYLALCVFFSGFCTWSAAGFFQERVLSIGSFNYGPCQPARHNESYNFTLLHFDVQVTDNGNIVFTGSFKTKINITSPLMATVDLRKRILFGIMFKIPCINDFGSCSSQDICEYGMPEGLECPPFEEGEGFPCRCPVEPGIYKMPGVWTGELAKTRWAYLFTGYYIAMITLYQGGTEMTCYKIEFSLE